MDEGIRLNVPGINARYLRGVSNYNLLDSIAAIPDLKSDAEFSPKSLVPWTFLGRAYRRAGMIELAIDVFMNTLELDPTRSRDGAGQTRDQAQFLGNRC
jgi:tetratricopeptide (TPR) repeat protein